MKDHACAPRSSESTAISAAQSLIAYDWGQAWRDNEGQRVHRDNADYWTQRAKDFPTTGQHSSYVDGFLDRAGIQPGDSVLDMGCGTGALAIPLAKAGHRVIAADFSTGMLEALERDLAECHDATTAARITPKLLSWTDDWEEAGLCENSVDVAIASRSMVTSDLRQSLEKLSVTARRHVCITLPTELSPRHDGRLLRQIGVNSRTDNSVQYAFLILHAMGYLPEVSYITNERTDSFESADHAFEALVRMIPSEPTESMSKADIDRAASNLRLWLEAELVENPHYGESDDRGKPQARLTLREPRLIRWAFLRWEV